MRWAVLALAALLAGCASTTEPSSAPSASVARPSPSAALSTEPPPVPTDQAEPAEFELPTPVCPSPPGPVIVPDVLVSIGDAPGVIASRGATTFTTCTTTDATDVAGGRALPTLTARPGDRFLLRIQNGWSILRVEGFDAPAVGEGGNIQAPIDTPQGVDRVEAPVPQREGGARASWTLFLIRVDGRAVGQLEVSILVQLVAGG